MGKSRRTAVREIQRGKTAQRRISDWKDIEYYSAELVQIRADENKRNHGPAEKIGSDRTLAAAIADKIRKEKYSPYAVTAGSSNDIWPGFTRLCAKTIYRYIGKGIFAETSEADLPRRGKRRKKRAENRLNTAESGPLGAVLTSVPPPVSDIYRALSDTAKTHGDLTDLYNVFSWFCLEDISNIWYRYLDNNYPLYASLTLTA